MSLEKKLPCVRNSRTRFWALGLASLGLLLTPGCVKNSAPDNGDAVRSISVEDYRRAEQFLSWRKDDFIQNDKVTPNWIGEENSFWYQRFGNGGRKEFVRVDAASGRKAPAFDHEAVAASLAQLTGQNISADSIPFDTFKYNDRKEIEFQIAEKTYSCAAQCREIEAASPVVRSGEALSPDGKSAVYFKNHNLWLRALDGSAEYALTTDGQPDNAYGISVGTDFSTVSRQRFGQPETPLVLFSPDGRKLLTQRIDQRKVNKLHLLQYAPEGGGYRPKLYTYRYAFALDEHKPMARFVLFDLDTGERVDVDYPEIPISVIPHAHPLYQSAFWQKDGQAFYFIDRVEFGRGYGIQRVDASTGQAKQIAERKSSEAAFPAVSVATAGVLHPVVDDGVIWWSDETGWGHLYYSTVDGARRQLTDGDWTVFDVIRVDESSDTVFFLRGRSEADGVPYHATLSSVKLDGSDFRNLTPEAGVHEVSARSFSPTGEFFVDTFSSTEVPAVSLLRRANGDIVTELEEADVSKLMDTGLIVPETFEVLAADGKTRLWGKLLKPSNFDPTKSYPVIDSIYPGPQSFRVGHNYAGTMDIRYVGGFSGLFSTYGEPQALAELGFIVVMVDGRGTAGRSREFHYDADNGLLAEAGHIDDHVAAIKELAKTRPWMDLERVGIYGHSGGGYASTHALLEYPDFFKVAVSSAGNHEQRAYLPLWAEGHLGANDGRVYDLASNPQLATHLEGKLLIVINLLDDDVHPAASYQLIEAFIQANKDFDLLVMPNANHHFASLSNSERSYFIRRKWDYFVRHLMKAEPPNDYKLDF